MNLIIFMVILVLHTGEGRPDIIGRIEVDSEAVCWEMAHEWVDKGVTDKERELGGLAVSGACYTNKPEVHT